MSYEYDENKNGLETGTYESDNSGSINTTDNVIVETETENTVSEYAESVNEAQAAGIYEDAEKEAMPEEVVTGNDPVKAMAADNITVENTASDSAAGQTQTAYSSFEQMRFSPEEQEKQNTGKKKKEKKPMPVFAKYALGGVVFGLCGALAFSGIMVIGNKTFLKKDADTVAEAVEEKSAGKEESLRSETAKDNDKKAEKESKEEAGVGDTISLPTTKTSSSASIAEITQNAMPSIVSITVKGVEEVRSMFGTQEYESEGAGSGIVVGEDDEKLLIATNNHVVSGANEVSVCFNDSEDAVVAATVEGTDPKNDLAIVSVDKEDIDKDVLKQVKVISIGSSADLSVGDQVIAIGNALGYGQSVTTGIVSALDREAQIENMAAKLIQTDAAINPGNSGGALLNMKGELVGINSAKFASETVEGMGYAIPIDTAKPILDKLINRASKEVVSDEEAGFMGITVTDVSKEASENYGIPEGAYIATVEEGGAADKAGIAKGDVIVEFDGTSVNGASDLKEQIAYYRSGETVEVKFMRMDNGGYKENTVKVTLAKSKAIEEQREKEKKAEDSKKENSMEEDYDENDGQEMRPEIPNRNEDRAEEYGHGDSGYGNDGYGDGSFGYGSGEDLEDFFNRFFGQAEEYGYQVQPQQGY